MFESLIHEILYYIIVILGAATLSIGIMNFIDYLEGRKKK